MLVYVADTLECMAGLLDLSQITAAVPVVDVEQRACRPVGSPAEIELAEELVRIGRIADHTGTVGRRSLGYDDIGAGICL